MSGKNAIAKIVLAALLSLVGLSVVGVGQAYAASSTTVTSVTPDTGTANGGGTAIVIKGTNFGLTGDTSQSGVTAVTFGGVPATSYTFVHGTQVDAVVPPAMSPTAVVDVQVTANAETSPITAADEYTYTWTAAPTVTAVGQTAVTATSETSNVVTVTAAGTWTTGQEVTLGGFVNGLTPAVYTILAGGSGSFTISFAGAIVTSDPGTGVVSPTAAGAIGPTTGTTPVVIAGTNLAGASAVDFGSTAATSFTIVSATEITAVAPAGSVGPVDITVTTPDATSATSSADTYSYITTPTVTGVTTVASPAGGPAGGGTQVT
ncbi:MAG: IPT/TIG domain-containing protein, partial [Acidimicrobiales bacterium]